MEQSPPRHALARGAVALLVVALLLPAGVSAFTYDPTDFERGNITSPANGSTVVGIQGFHFRGRGSTKKPARLASIGPNGDLNWRFDGSTVNARWFYDVDPLQNGHLLVTSTNPRGTVIFEFAPERKEVVWTERFDIRDTHDADLINGDQLLVANKNAYNETTGVSHDRIFIYDRSKDEVVWEWEFRNHYPNSTDGGFHHDWTHVNDVDKISDGRYLVSPRNFDQVIVVNRSTKEIEMRLGSDGNRSTLFEQHNPDFLVSRDGNPTLLVADSENDRVVEYERRCSTGDPMTAPPEQCHWTKTWQVGTGQLTWPRDADRLPNGNTLITDTLNHRIVEVTPNGTIVWEYYATWGPYDAERLGATNVSAPWTGGSARGPTMADLNAGGTYRLSGSANDSPVASDGDGGPGAALAAAGFEGLARTWSHVAPWAKPVWMSGWDFLFSLLAFLLALGWVTAEVVVNRDRIRARLTETVR